MSDHMSPTDRKATSEARRKETRRSSHGDWTPAADRPDPVQYAAICGWTLAHAHARSGDPIAIAGYLGSGDVFDRAITEFAHTYADQNDRDYEVFVDAIRSGRIEVGEG